ncbi:MAG: 6-pyruvoyl tetrahydropterin synthase family protein [Thermoplasmatota archaeon]
MSLRLEIDGWQAGIRFSSAHLIPGHVKCHVLHGHTYAIHLRIYGEKNTHGFLIDFSEIKSVLKSIAYQLDHKVLVPKANKAFTVENNEIHASCNNKKYIFPFQDCVILPIDNVTAENLAEYILSEVLKKIHLPLTISSLEIGVDEGVGQGAWIKKKVC